MVRKWIWGGIVAAGLALSGATAQAATITDATVEIGGSYAHKSDRYQFNGDFTGDLLNHPKMERLYDIGITISMRGKTVLTQSLSASKLASAPFSVRDVLMGDITSSGIGALLRGLDLTSKVNSKSTSAKGDFAGKLSKSGSKVLNALCRSQFSNNAAKKCIGPGEFGIVLAFTYDEPTPPLAELREPEGSQPSAAAPSPVPLPAGLPLLGAGLGALALMRRRRC